MGNLFTSDDFENEQVVLKVPQNEHISQIEDFNSKIIKFALLEKKIQFKEIKVDKNKFLNYKNFKNTLKNCGNRLEQLSFPILEIGDSKVYNSMQDCLQVINYLSNPYEDTIQLIPYKFEEQKEMYQIIKKIMYYTDIEELILSQKLINNEKQQQIYKQNTQKTTQKIKNLLQELQNQQQYEFISNSHQNNTYLLKKLSQKYEQNLLKLNDLTHLQQLNQIYLKNTLDALQKLLQQNKEKEDQLFLSGSNFTLADIVFLVFLDTLIHIDLENEIYSRPIIYKYFQSHKIRENFKQVKEKSMLQSRYYEKMKQQKVGILNSSNSDKQQIVGKTLGFSLVCVIMLVSALSLKYDNSSNFKIFNY